MSADMEAKFLGQLLGPALRNNSITKDMKVMIYDDQRDLILEYTKQVKISCLIVFKEVLGLLGSRCCKIY